MPRTRAKPPRSLFARPQESISSSGTPHKRDSFIYSTWLEDSVSTASGGSSPGIRPQAAPPRPSLCSWGTGMAPGGGCVPGLPLT